MNFCQTQSYSTAVFGETRLHLELDLNKIVVNQYLSSTATSGWDYNGRNTFEDLTATQGADLTKLFCAKQFQNLADSPFYVNQKILINGSQSATGIVGAILTNTISTS